MFELPKNSKITFIFTALIATVFFFILLYFFPKIEKFSVEIISANYIGTEILHYSDLDSDGESEKIRFFRDFDGVAALIVEKQGKILYQHNFTDQFIEGRFYSTGDFDNDGLKEIYAFTYSNDSIFLNIIEGISDKLISPKIFLTTYLYHANSPDYGITHIEMEDFNDNGYNDIFLSITCGFSYKTRKCIIYDIAIDELLVSPSTGVFLENEISFYDISGNGKKEIFGNIKAHGNTPDNYFLTDKSLWLYIYNSKLEFLFPPVNIGFHPGWVKTRPLINDDNKSLAVLKYHIGNLNDSTFLGIYDLKGNRIHKKHIEFDENSIFSVFKTYPKNNPHQILLLKSNGLLQKFDKNLSVIGEKQLIPYDYYLYSFDIDGDGEKESFLQKGENISIASGDLNYINPLPPDITRNMLPNACLIEKKRKAPILVLQDDNMQYHIEYRRNLLYKYRFALYPGIWISIFFIVYFIGLVFQKIATKRLESERKLTALQITAIENQLSPHFNLNILNSIGALYESHEKEKAQYFLGKYGKLMRNLLMYSGNISVTVEEELEFTKNYLELEKLRMNHSFDYVISGEADYLNMEIPKMLIHTFCENSLKHGLRHLSENGKLEIHFLKEKQFIKIFISDNGIGRAKAKQYSLMSTRKGLKIINQTLELYFQLKQIRINFNISDIYDDRQKVAGTKVEITVPV